MTSWSPFQPSEDALPPEDVRIVELRAEPWPENAMRLRIHLEITPFQERPSLEVLITGPDGAQLSSIFIIETIEALMTFTMHLRGESPSGPLLVYARLFYSEDRTIDEKSISYDPG
jgi:hypothetical protein